MKKNGFLFLALGVLAVISTGAVTNQIVPLAATGVAIDDMGITFPDGSVQTTAAGGLILMHGNGAPTGIGDAKDRWALNGADNQVEESRASYGLTRSGTAQSLCVISRFDTAATASVDVTVYHNGLPTALKVTLTDADGVGTAKCDLVNTVPVTQGNRIVIRMEGTPATPDVNPDTQYFASFEVI